MNYDDLKEKVIEAIEDFKDSELWQTGSEKFQSLAPNIQKLVIGFGIFTVTLFCFSCLGPVGFLSDSSEAILVFEEKRDQIRNLLLAKQKENQTSSIPQQMSSDQFRNSVLSAINSAGLLPEQNNGIQPYDVSNNSMRPKKASTIKQDGLAVSLKKLNLNQIINIGTELEKINETVKISGMNIVASTDDDHYFDVTYQMIRFSLDTRPKEPADDKKSGKRRKKRGN